MEIKLNQLILESLAIINDQVSLMEHEDDVAKNPHDYQPIYHRGQEYERGRLGMEVQPIAHVHKADMELYHHIQNAKNAKDVDHIIKGDGVTVDHGKTLHGWEHGGAHMKGGSNPTKVSEVHPDRLHQYKDAAFSHATGHDVTLLPHIHYTVKSEGLSKE